MSQYHYIFIHPGSPREQLLADISFACGVQLAPVSSECVDCIDYAASLGQAAVEVELSHEYEEDHGIPFGRYESLFTVRDFGSDLARQEALAREIFGRLASLGRYSLMLVLDLQQLIETAPQDRG
ncbi:hypothetical protein G5C60_49155 [Streptomyces sp. HC44]|uniref:Uncharacterized protein n=1 Tax=Streptomyces scabichelini TaxID=2711217 RepID=A0A6G4VNC3_9ACTN|nr:hypothetical protein [Streptomyces scabichelini]NGO15345.1 hypothetical protein [Streptomyces scabichelini]